jgi:hypothetical membrane protein
VKPNVVNRSANAMPTRPPVTPEVSLPRSLRLVGLTGAALGVLTVVGSTIAYSRHHEFSVFTTYLSDVGNTPGWPATLFNTGMLVVAPIRFAFLALLLAVLARHGASRPSRHAALALGLVAVVGSVGTAAVPFSFDRTIHMSSAFMYFLGTVVLQALIAWMEWRARLPRILPAASLLVVAVYLVFAILLALVGKTPAVTRETPVPWEWLAFLSLMVWLVAHSIILGAEAQTSDVRDGEA